MTDCHSTAVAGCHGNTTQSEPQGDSCGAGCGPARGRPDWFLWSCLAAVVVAYGWGALVVGAADEGAIAQFTGGVFELMNRMWWGLAIGVLFVGILGTVPRDLVMALLGRQAGLGGMFRATLAGVLLDLCSHGILAVGMRLYERGASVGQVMAFLLASPWNSLSLTLILIALIGLGWTLLFIGLSLVIGITTGLLFDGFVRRGTLPQNPHRDLEGEAVPLRQQLRDYRRSLQFSLAGTGRLLVDGVRGSKVVIRWALFGLLLAAAIRGLVPADIYANWFGASVVGLWLTLAAATIIEVCSEGATPIAADLLNRAKAPGNAFTFLMAGVATDYTEVMSIKDTSGSWRLALFLPLLTVPQVMILGYLLNQFA
jgi:uncharacterized membrane protein YraQ (UPF0718 family)